MAEIEDIHSLVKEGQALLEQARTESSGRASLSLIHGEHQRAVLMGLTAGSQLAEHDSPKAASLQVLRGHARLFIAGAETPGSPTPEWLLQDGDLIAIPQARHGVDALSDAILLLTVTL